jgi:hypothetical protein
MRSIFFIKLPRWIQALKGLSRKPSRVEVPLVAQTSKPATLEQRYEPIDYPPLSDEVFVRLKKRIYQELDRYARQPASRAVFRESGKLSTGRPYFYLKPAGEIGWLFERNGSGWLVSPAEKDAVRDLFVREREVFDHAELYLAKDRATMPRVKAPGLGSGEGLLSLPVYEQKLLQRLGLV